VDNSFFYFSWEWLQTFSEPKLKLEIVVQYLSKYITKVIKRWT